MPLPVDPQEMVRPSSGLHGVDRHGRPTIGAVLEANGHRQARGHLTVGLALGGAGTNGRPADQISDVLRNDRIQQFRGRR